MKTLETLCLNELADMYDAESRLARVLPKLGKAAANRKLQRMLREHATATADRAAQLASVFRRIGKTVRRRPCAATMGLIHEAQEIAAEFTGSPASDAAVISAIRKLVQYQIVAYGCLGDWAATLGHAPASQLLSAMAAQADSLNKSLARLARDQSNRQALGESRAEVARGARNLEQTAAR
jgi:ferritin-like metal-binding protein YciE